MTVTATRESYIKLTMSILEARGLLVVIARAKKYDIGQPMPDVAYKIEKCLEKVLPDVDEITRHQE